MILSNKWVIEILTGKIFEQKLKSESSKMIGIVLKEVWELGMQREIGSSLRQKLSQISAISSIHTSRSTPTN
jgi:hypothetical protein